MERESWTRLSVWFCLLQSAVARICRRAAESRLLISATVVGDRFERCLALACDWRRCESTEATEVEAAGVEESGVELFGVVVVDVVVVVTDSKLAIFVGFAMIWFWPSVTDRETLIWRLRGFLPALSIGTDAEKAELRNLAGKVQAVLRFDLVVAQERLDSKSWIVCWWFISSWMRNRTFQAGCGFQIKQDVRAFFLALGSELCHRNVGIFLVLAVVHEKFNIL